MEIKVTPTIVRAEALLAVWDAILTGTPDEQREARARLRELDDVTCDELGKAVLVRNLERANA